MIRRTGPGRTEVVACRPWLLGELRLVGPEVVVLMGAVAAKAVMGPSFKLTQHRGELLELPSTVDDEQLPEARVSALGAWRGSDLVGH